MSRTINLETAGKDRQRMLRSILLAIRELMRQTDADSQTRDLAAYIALALEAVAETIDASVAAWEKRGYWVKADRFRMDWLWAEQLGKRMRQSVLEEDWPAVASTAAQVASKLSKIKVPQRAQPSEPWKGAWARISGNH